METSLALNGLPCKNIVSLHYITTVKPVEKPTSEKFSVISLSAIGTCMNMK